VLGSPRVFFVQCRHVAGSAHLDHLARLSPPRPRQSLSGRRSSRRSESARLALVAKSVSYAPRTDPERHYPNVYGAAPDNHASYDYPSRNNRRVASTAAATATTPTSD
jgi:hypothetical protein